MGVTDKAMQRDQGADVPGVAGCDEAAPRQTYVLTHQFLADAFVARL